MILLPQQFLPLEELDLVTVQIIGLKSILNCKTHQIHLSEAFFFCEQILHIFRTEHGSNTAGLCAKYMKDLSAETDVKGEKELTGF